MRSFRTYMVYLLGFILALAIILVGSWFYIVSTVEQPKYVTVEKDGAVEIRKYPTLVVAEVTRRGTRNDAVRAGFGPLAGYIFAKNRSGEKVSMTAPVTQTLANGSWTIRFIMPSKYSLETLPKAAGDDVRLSNLPATLRAAIQFSGVATDASIAEHEEKLKVWLAAHSKIIRGEPTYAYYNDPFTPGPLRRNEVLFDLDQPAP
jgi:SOUL heme-binding protein